MNASSCVRVGVLVLSTSFLPSLLAQTPNQPAAVKGGAVAAYQTALTAALNFFADLNKTVNTAFVIPNQRQDAVKKLTVARSTVNDIIAENLALESSLIRHDQRGIEKSCSHLHKMLSQLNSQLSQVLDLVPPNDAKSASKALTMLSGNIQQKMGSVDLILAGKSGEDALVLSRTASSLGLQLREQVSGLIQELATR